MTISSHNGNKLKWLRLPIAIMILAIFFTAALPSQSAKADPDAGAIAGQTAAQTGLFATLGALITGAFAALQDALISIQTFLMTHGFSAVSSAITGTGMINTKLQELIGNFHAQTAMYVPQVTNAAQNQSEATLANQSIACQTTQYWQAKERLSNNPLGTAASFIESNSCKGPHADCSGPGRLRERFNDLCQLGFMSPGTAGGQYGDLPSTANCKSAMDVADSSYIDRDENLEAFLMTPQMVMASPCILADGFPSFSGPQGSLSCQSGTSASATYDAITAQSQLAWVAAYKFCENLDIPVSTPTYSTSGRPPNDYDIKSMMNDRTATTLRMGGAKTICLKFLFERTACPSGASNPKAIGMSDTCHDDQVQICNSLKNQPNPNGADVAGAQGAPAYPANGDKAGLGFSGNPVVQNCDQYGLSELMAQQIKDHPCADSAYMQSRGGRTGGDATKLEDYSDITCDAKDAEWKKYVQGEYQQLISAMSNAEQMRIGNVGALAAPTAGAR